MGVCGPIRPAVKARLRSGRQGPPLPDRSIADRQQSCHSGTGRATAYGLRRTLNARCWSRPNGEVLAGGLTAVIPGTTMAAPSARPAQGRVHRLELSVAHQTGKAIQTYQLNCQARSCVSKKAAIEGGAGRTAGDRDCWRSVLSKEALETDPSRDGSRDEFREKQSALLGLDAFGKALT